MKADEFIVKILLKPGKHCEFMHHLKRSPGYLDHKFIGGDDNIEVQDLRNMEIDYDDWLILEKEEVIS